MNKEYLSYFEDYLIDIKISKTDGTYRFYRNHLLHIGRFFYENNIETLADVDRNVIVEYLAMLRNTVEAATINKRVGIIKRCFLFYGIEEHYIHSIKKFKEKQNSYDMITDEALSKIIRYIASLDPSVNNNLLYTGIILIFINTGVRLTELYNIEKRNVNLDNCEILLTKTKNGKKRIVYFRPLILPDIKMLMGEKTNHKYLLHNRTKNRPVNYSDIKYIFNKLKSELGIKKLHPHMFRHTFATKLLQAGVDIKTVMDFMGHTNLATTQRYQHSNKEHAKKSYMEKYKY